jgi:hypothetical protein
MAKSTDIEIEQFTQKVLQQIRSYPETAYESARKPTYRAAHGPTYSDYKHADKTRDRRIRDLSPVARKSPTTKKPAAKKKSSTNFKRKLVRKSRKKTVIAKKRQAQATKILRDQNVKIALCNGLKSVSNDAFDIAKIVTPSLVALNATSQINIPLDPFLFATLAITIARLGISTLCADYVPIPKKRRRNRIR